MVLLYIEKRSADPFRIRANIELTHCILVDSYTHCQMLEESICHFRGVGFTLSILDYC